MESAAVRTTCCPRKRCSVNPTFEREYDAWDGKNENARFFVGKTSQTLRYIGVKSQEVVWDASKIIKVKRDHPAMTDEIIKQVPSVIEDPIIVMESKTVPGRITMFGELADADGAPVLVALELEPTKDHRLNMEVIKIASAYGKDTSPQKLLDESRVLFVDPNKNRTQTWLKLYKLQLPSSAKYGLNGRVTYRNASVNPSIRKNVQENAKDGGGARFSIRDNMTEAERYDELKDAELYAAYAAGRNVYFKENASVESAYINKGVTQATTADGQVDTSETSLASPPDSSIRNSSEKINLSAQDAEANAASEQEGARATELTGKRKAYKRRHERAFIENVAKALGIPGTAKGELRKMISELGDRVIATGQLSEADAKAMF